MKRIVLWVLVGWGLALLISPRDVVGYFRKS
jgi:hypothetical protein